MYDVEVLKEGETATYPDANKEGRAYKEKFQLRSGSDDYRIGRVSNALSIYMEMDIEGKKGTWEVLADCKKSTHRTQKAIVDKHNQSVGG